MESVDNIGFEVWAILNRTRHLMYKARQKELDQYGISVRNAAVLNAVLILGKQATPGRIGQLLFLEQHSISETLTRMERKGLIKKIRDLDKKSSIRIEITDDGHELFQKSLKHESINDIMSVLSQEETLQLQSLLLTVREKVAKQLGFDSEWVSPISDLGES